MYSSLISEMEVNLEYSTKDAIRDAIEVYEERFGQLQLLKLIKEIAQVFIKKYSR